MQWPDVGHCIARPANQYGNARRQTRPQRRARDIGRASAPFHPPDDWPDTLMPLLDRLFPSLRHRADPRAALRPLYAAIVARGRETHWYAQGAVPDTLDGRFDMIAAILCAVLLRLEGEDDARQGSVWLTEIFIEDMDGQLRQIGIGDMIVGKHIGKMMAALGGRLTAYREGLAEGGDPNTALHGALVRNLYRGDAPDAAALDHVAAALRALWAALADTPTQALLAGGLPR